MKTCANNKIKGMGGGKRGEERGMIERDK